jgi:hypothetical protein
MGVDWQGIKSQTKLDQIIATMSDKELHEDFEAVLSCRNGLIQQEWLASDEGRYRTLAEKILGREPKGIPLPTLSICEEDSHYPKSIWGLTPRDDTKLWLKLKDSIQEISLEAWRELQIDERLPILESVCCNLGKNASPSGNNQQKKKSGTPTKGQRDAVFRLLKDYPNIPRKRLRTRLKESGVAISNERLSKACSEFRSENAN